MTRANLVAAPELFEDVEDARRGGEIACAVVLRELIDQTVKRLHMLGREQIALVDRGFNQVADVGVDVERIDLGTLAF